MKTSDLKRLALLAAGLLPLCGHAQVNSGSNGSDGALNPTGNLVIDMADHPGWDLPLHVGQHPGGRHGLVHSECRK